MENPIARSLKQMPKKLLVAKCVDARLETSGTKKDLIEQLVKYEVAESERYWREISDCPCGLKAKN